TTLDTVNFAGSDTVLQLDGTTFLDSSRNLTNINTTEFNGITYTWPGAQSAGRVLQTDGSGTLSWVDTATSDLGLFDLSDGAIAPKNLTVDFLVGGTSTASAAIGLINVNDGTPTATISGGLSGATYLTADGTLATTNMQTLTLGGSTTGDIVLSARNNANDGIILSGYGAGAIQADENGRITSGTLITEFGGTGF